MRKSLTRHLEKLSSKLSPERRQNKMMGGEAGGGNFYIVQSLSIKCTQSLHDILLKYIPPFLTVGGFHIILTSLHEKQKSLNTFY